MPHQRSDYELDERAAEATFLLNHPILKEVINTLHERYVLQITNSEPGEKLIAAHAKLRVIHEVENAIQDIIRDKKIADKKGKQYG